MSDPIIAAQPAPDDELEALFEQPTVLDVRGRQVTVKPMNIRQLGRAAAIVNRIVRESKAEGRAANLDVASLVADHCDDVIAIVAVATGEPEKWISELRPDDFVDLATIVFRVNASFVLGRLAPRLAEIVPALGLMTLPAGGLISSPSSSSTVTPIPEA